MNGSEISTISPKEIQERIMDLVRKGRGLTANEREELKGLNAALRATGQRRIDAR